MLLLTPFVLALVVVIVGGYLLHWRWTGYLSTQGTHPPRTVWDWLTLLLQPLALAFVPVYFKLRGRRSTIWPAALLSGAAVLAVLIIGGYTSGWTWTGFEGNTLWDWLGLFLVPFLLPLALVLIDAELEHKRRAEPTPAVAETAVPPRQRRWSPGRTTLAACGLLAVGLAGGWVAHIPTSAPAAPGTPPGTVLADVTVDTTSPTWTATHLRVVQGQRLQISAFGLARSGASQPTVGPDGERQPHPPRQSVVQGIPHLALLAMVLPPSRRTDLPLAALVPGRLVVGVGAHDVFTAPATGELMLGVNDTGPANNRGWFGVTISR